MSAAAIQTATSPHTPASRQHEAQPTPRQQLHAEASAQGWTLAATCLHGDLFTHSVEQPQCVQQELAVSYSAGGDITSAYSTRFDAYGRFMSGPIAKEALPEHLQQPTRGTAASP